MKQARRNAIGALTALFITIDAASAQTPVPSPSPAPEATTTATPEVTTEEAITATEALIESLSPDRAAALAALVETIRSSRATITSLEQALPEAPTDLQREEIEAELREAEARLQTARFDLLDIATRVDLSKFETVTEQSFSLQGSLEELIQPVVEEAKRATRTSRETQKIRKQLEDQQERKQIISQALKTLDTVIQSVQSEVIREELLAIRNDWGERLRQVENRLAVLEFRMNELTGDEASLLDQTRDAVASFFRVRGRNLLLAIAAALVVFFGMKLLGGLIRSKSPLHRGPRSFGTRLFDVVYVVATALFSIGAAVLVFVIAGDWVLFSLVILILLGVALAARDTIPGYIDDARMLLNLGTVREGERIVHLGLPWLVEDLNFYTILRNPSLQGGMVRMPVANLREYLSRPAESDEPYFPSDKDDWVLLDDEGYGQVKFQSAEMVTVKLLEQGAEKTYQTSAYLDQNPQNLSHGFSVRTTIGIDYAEQPRVTSELLEKLREFFNEAVKDLVEPEEIRSLSLEFSLANASSLDYEIIFRVKGSAAPRYRIIERALQRIGVDACNKFDLTIPFQQITLHQGDS